MKPTKFKESNLLLGAGGNPNTNDMPVMVAQNPEMSAGHPIDFVVSKWKLSEEELKKVNETGCIYLSVMGQPSPVYIFTEEPKEIGFIPYSTEYMIDLARRKNED